MEFISIGWTELVTDRLWHAHVYSFLHELIKMVKMMIANECFICCLKDKGTERSNMRFGIKIDNKRQQIPKPGLVANFENLPKTATTGNKYGKSTVFKL
jgi:hypothetical protein